MPKTAPPMKMHVSPFYNYMLLAAVLTLGLLLIREAPADLLALKTLYIELQPGQETVIGRNHLLQKPGAGAAELAHVRVRRDSGGAWELANRAAAKRVEALFDHGGYRFLKRFKLRQGDTLTLNTQTLTITKLDARGRLIELQDAQGKQWRWRRGTSQILNAGAATVDRPACESTRSAWWQDLRRRPQRLFSLGGLYDCHDRMALQGVPIRSAWVIWQADAFWLGPGENGARIYFQREGQEQPQSFSQLFLPLVSPEGVVRQIVVGRTYYDVGIENDRLRLTAVTGMHYWFKHELVHAGCTPVNLQSRWQCQESATGQTQSLEHVRWLGQGQTMPEWLIANKVWLLALLLVSVALSVPVLFIQRRGHFLRKTPYELALVLPGVFGLMSSLIAYHLGEKPDLTWLLALLWAGWLWATVVLQWGRRLRGYAGAIWFCGVWLAALGSLTLVQLSVGSLNGRWLTYAHKHLFVLTVFAWLTVLFNAIPVAAWQNALQALSSDRSRFWSHLRFTIPAALIALLLLQTLFGAESGVFGVQPVESAKFVMILVAAYTGLQILEMRRMAAKAYRDNPLGFIFSALLAAVSLLLFASMIMFQVRDFSPFLILFSFVMAMLWRLAAHPLQKNLLPTWTVRGALLVAVVLFLSGARLIYAQSPPWLTWLPQYERFLVWSNPAAYPHTGAQLLAALDFVHQGKWLGATSRFFGYNENVEIIPAVHNDFIAAFVIFKFGGAGALVLLAGQILFLYTLWRLSEHYGYKLEPGDYNERAAFQVYAIVLFGIVWMYGVHWIISWGNVLGLMPVMGQPMTWISAANSHLLFFALPAFYLVLVLAWIAHECDDGYQSGSA